MLGPFFDFAIALWIRGKSASSEGMEWPAKTLSHACARSKAIRRAFFWGCLNPDNGRDGRFRLAVGCADGMGLVGTSSSLRQRAFFRCFLSFINSCLLNLDSSSVTTRVRLRGRAYGLILAFFLGMTWNWKNLCVKIGRNLSDPGNCDPDELRGGGNRYRRGNIFRIQPSTQIFVSTHHVIVLVAIK